MKHTAHEQGRWILAVFLAGSLAQPATFAEDAPRASPPQPGKPALYAALRDVINRGADLYNTGDSNGCYRLFQGALLAARPQLDDRPALQKSIDAALARAERVYSVPEKAFALRKTLDEVRAAIRPVAPGRAAEGVRATDKERGRQGNKETSKARASSLWSRLGDEAKVRKIVDDFVTLAAEDARVDFSRGGKYKLDAAAVARLKKELVDFVSAAGGGPFSYAGRSMKEVHKGMGITNAQLDALAADLRRALQENGAKPGDIDQVLQAVEGTRKDIVEK